MALELRQNLKLAQQLVMTPQLQQAIKLLQLSRIELIDTINQELESNPLLEESNAMDEPSQDKNEGGSITADDQAANWEEAKIPTLASTEDQKTPWEEQAVKDINWKDYWEDESRTTLPSYSFEQKEAPNYENIISSSQDLSDHLTWQLQMADMDEEEIAAGLNIIGNLDKNGYLKASVENIADSTGIPAEKVEATLKKIQSFDPVGVAARDLRECLLIQIDSMGFENRLIRLLVSDYLHQIELHNYQAIAKATGCSVNEVVEAIDIITTLEPRPGRQYNSDDTHYIVPDIYVYKVDDEYVISMNDDGIPNLRISAYYKNAIKQGSGGAEAKDFIQDKLKSALWLVKSIQQRKKTIYKVTESIVRFQRDFFEHGISHLKPLILRNVAEDVNMHESTISRVTTNKYVHTPQGIYELKFFFSSGLPGKSGTEVATQSVKDRIKQLVSAEDPVKPYSDKQIVEMLAKDNIKIARRTVAKYRDMLGILPSNRRKRPRTT